MNSTSKPTDNGVVNLGLASLISGEPVEVKTQPITQISTTWVETQIERSDIPLAILAERAIELSLEVNGASPESRAAVKRVLESVLAKGAHLSAELQERIVSAQKGTLPRKQREEVPELMTHMEPGVPHPPPDPSAVKSEVSSVPEWKKFASMVESLQLEKPAKPGMAIPSRSGQSFYRPAIFTAAVVLLIVAIRWAFSASPGRVAENEFQFARGSWKATLSPVDSEGLLRPTFELSKNFGSLSTLAYEISTRPAVKPVSAVPERSGVPVGALEPAQPPVVTAPKEKEPLQIGSSNEPAALRDIQIEPEKPLADNSFEFPPFINKVEPKQEARLGGMQGDGGVKRFVPPRQYSVTVETQILSRPSYWAASYGSYDAGEIIMVDAHIGAWIRVIGENGRAGFILAQDASPL